MAKLDTYIHCCACQSEWLGHKALFDEEEPCPYCSDRGTVHFGEPEQCLYCATPKMTLGDALDHLGHLVDMAAPEDTHYRRASEVFADAIEKLAAVEIVQRDIAQALESLEQGDIGGAADQLRALIKED